VSRFRKKNPIFLVFFFSVGDHSYKYRAWIHKAKIKISLAKNFHPAILIGFGGLEVACWPLVPKFAGSNPAEAVGFLGAKKSSARLPSEGK